MWRQRQIDLLAEMNAWTYDGGRNSATEPAAWTVLALAASSRIPESLRAAKWLAGLQQSDGAVGVSAAEEAPRWPTSLSVLAWQAVNRATATNTFDPQIDKAVDWILKHRGKTAEQKPQIGHDTTIAGWSWAADTHSWMEPTCFSVMALRSAGRHDHPRGREGVRMLVNRLLPSGGANYGNTVVLGQELLPHMQPTGLVLLTLAGEKVDDLRIAASLDYLEEEVKKPTGTPSLCFALIGLSAYDRRPSTADDLIDGCLRRNHQDRSSAHTLALSLLAAQQDAFWLPREPNETKSASLDVDAGAASRRNRPWTLTSAPTNANFEPMATT